MTSPRTRDSVPARAILLRQFRHQVALGPVDYVRLDFLAEITMSIMQKQLGSPANSYLALDRLLSGGKSGLRAAAVMPEF